MIKSWIFATELPSSQMKCSHWRSTDSLKSSEEDKCFRKSWQLLNSTLLRMQMSRKRHDCPSFSVQSSKEYSKGKQHSLTGLCTGHWKACSILQFIANPLKTHFNEVILCCSAWEHPMQLHGLCMVFPFVKAGFGQLFFPPWSEDEDQARSQNSFLFQAGNSSSGH